MGSRMMDAKTAIKLIDERMCFGRGKWSKNHMPVIDEYWQAGMMAIEALTLPAAQLKIVRCKDCRYMKEHYDTDGNVPYWTCSEWDSGTDYDGFCHLGERRTDG